jgi:hypothetical protein
MDVCIDFVDVAAAVVRVAREVVLVQSIEVALDRGMAIIAVCTEPGSVALRRLRILIGVVSCIRGVSPSSGNGVIDDRFLISSAVDESVSFGVGEAAIRRDSRCERAADGKLMSLGGASVDDDGLGCHPVDIKESVGRNESVFPCAGLREVIGRRN